MSTIKISQLPELTHIDSNTSNTLLVAVDVTTGTTKQVSANTLAHGLYAYNPLYVGETTDAYIGTIAQFTSSSNSYIQVNLENSDANGSADYIVTATGTNSNNFIDLGISGKLFNSSNVHRVLGTSVSALDGYLIVKGNTSGSPVGGNLVIGTSESSTETRFVAGGTNSSNIVAKITSAGLNFNVGKNIIFGDSSQQSTAAVTPTYSIAAFTKANDAYTLANTANITAIAAFVHANTKFSSSGGTISGNTVISEFLTLTKTDTSNVAPFRILSSANNAELNPSLNGYAIHISGKENDAARIIIDTFTDSANAANVWPSTAGRFSRGTAEAPTPAQAGDVLYSIAGLGWSPTGFAGGDGLGSARLDMTATQNFTDIAKGTSITFWNTPDDSNVAINIATFDANSAIFHGTITPQKGFIYTPNVQSSSAITIDYSRDVMLKVSSATGLTISHTNFVPGKIVEVWVINTAGTTQTLTHGLAASNSTKNSATFNMPSTSCAKLTFSSINSDLANTFVAITAG